jgi:hypothetical protein
MLTGHCELRPRQASIGLLNRFHGQLIIIAGDRQAKIRDTPMLFTGYRPNARTRMISIF